MFLNKSTDITSNVSLSLNYLYREINILLLYQVLDLCCHNILYYRGNIVVIIKWICSVENYIIRYIEVRLCLLSQENGDGNSYLSSYIFTELVKH